MPEQQVRKPRGAFIVIEGGDGAGKTTLARALSARLHHRGFDPLTTAEPTGMPIGEAIRAQLAGRPACPEAMALLYAADRAQHTEAVIRPALARGQVVVSTRYLLSSLAYQGPHVGIERVMTMNATALVPDLLLYLGGPASEFLARAATRSALDAFETAAAAASAAAGYVRGLVHLQGLGHRIRQVDAARPPDAVLADALQHVLDVLRP